MNEEQSMTPLELLTEVGSRLKAQRLQRNIPQADLADKAGVGERTLRQLENGEGSTLETYLRVLKALGLTSVLDAVAPPPPVSPMAALERGTEPQRASRKSK
ncbi:helix-turn-helix domain-containing protein [Pseudomarimonas arenosa]|uniref:Helix-turn-helix domain-containing protein n=1 Tax=Pseudomarimonas arenosa TaxID=2774145 RepID=A0AAW3ZMN0_9GAMM|nr:helix-turn-helix domain-containing protein [Pseudomarimonas arenosa]MBD8527403.1 helix-turn-helix domain-containing protein [Pseudomarimonas arenosa]